jgi:CheY-like chemotaxis protein
MKMTRPVECDMCFLSESEYPMKIPLPLYQHPTSVILVDDSTSFIASLEFQMNPSLAVKSFQNPNDALKWLHETYNTCDEKFLPIKVGYDEQTFSFERRTVELEVDKIYRTVMDPDRFNFPAVVVVDYAMPQIDGLDFCRALKGLPCKKILLTGEANEMVAVGAFNEGIIDRYLKKNDPQALERLEAQISALTKEYFLEKSGTLKDLLVQHSFAFWSDDIFGKLVESLSAQNDFVEYFLFPDPAGILFFDRHGKPMLMVVETKEGFIAHLESAQDYGAPLELQTALRDRLIVPFFWRSGGMYAEQSRDWEQYCMPAQVCAGREDYYWALFDLPEAFLQRPVYSYDKFLQDRALVNGK